MARDPKHVRAEPSLLPVLTLAATLGLSVLAWLLYRHFDREPL